MAINRRKSLEEYLALEYSFRVVADPEGGYVINFPDLPGCMTQVEDLAGVGPAAEEIRSLWIETEYEAKRDIPLPSQPPEFSGKFNLRLPRSLHRSLSETAETEGVSLNQLVVSVLSEGAVKVGLERRLERLESRLEEIHSHLSLDFSGVSSSEEGLRPSARAKSGSSSLSKP